MDGQELGGYNFYGQQHGTASFVPSEISCVQDEAAMLRRALSQSMHQLKLANSDAGAMVDRRIVTKLLLTWMERGRNDQSVLNLMASMLGFTGLSSNIAHASSSCNLGPHHDSAAAVLASAASSGASCLTRLATSLHREAPAWPFRLMQMSTSKQL